MHTHAVVTEGMACGRAWLWLGALATALFVAGPAAASHSTFSAAVDRVEVDGNVFGSAGGALDFVDEFDDGVLGPDWAVLVGSATEAGGVVTLHDPGFDVPFGANLDVSQVEHEDAITNGAGSGTVTAYFVPTLPATDREFNLQLYGIGSVVESIGLTFSNLSPAAAAQQNPPALAGYAVNQQLTHLSLATLAFQTLQYDAVAVNPASITGQVVLRLAFDDATDRITTSFSLDGGATFQSPFPPMPAFTGAGSGEILLGAATVGVPAPQPPQQVSLRSFDVKSGAMPETRRVKYSVSQFNTPLYGNPTAGAALNVDLDGTVQCLPMPAAGWRGEFPRYKYTDPTGFYGPVRAARIWRTGVTVKAQVVASGKHAALNLTPPNPGIQADMTLGIGGVGQYCSSTAGGTVRANTDKRYRVKGAPPPASCAVAACTP